MVDLIFRPIGGPVTSETFRDTDVISVGGCEMPVMSATVLMTFKLLTLSVHYCDFAPPLALARTLREQVDWARLRRDVAASPFATAFLRLGEELGIVPAEGEEPPPVTAPAVHQGRPAPARAGDGDRTDETGTEAGA
jgi:hypothetical protein